MTPQERLDKLIEMDQKNNPGGLYVAHILNNFRDNLRRLMKEQKLSQGTIAKKIGIEQEHVSRHMAGAAPSLKTVAKYAWALDVDISKLLED